ncbi:MAG: hypothetical protein ABGW77_02600 [Campylobacterales bacterium]
MEYCRVTLQFTTPMGTSLQSDTIFGHLAWGYRYLFGEKKLEELMAQFKTRPFIISTDGFPAGYLPKPLFPTLIGDCREMDHFKQVKKKRWIRDRFIFENIDNLTQRKIFEELSREVKKGGEGPAEVVEVVQHNSINRLSNLVDEGLYTTEERFTLQKYRFYLRVDLIERQEVEEVIGLISKIGYGRDRSIGKGRFQFQVEWEFPEQSLFKPNPARPYYLNLSNCFYNPENIQPVFGKTFTKFPKAGGINSNEPFKNPAIFYLPGSIFKVNGELVGKGENLYNRPHHYQNGFSLGLHFQGEIGVTNG